MLLASVNPPPRTVVALELLFEMLIIGVPVIVKFVLVVKLTMNVEDVLMQFMFPMPKAMVLAKLVLDENAPVVKVFPLISNVPLVTVAVCDAANVSAVRSCHVPPTPLNIMVAEIVTAFVVMVFAVVALKVIVPVALQIVPVTRDMLPEIANVPVLVNVTVPAETVISRHVSAPVIVTVYVPA
jgi:hypothetical protein